MDMMLRSSNVLQQLWEEGIAVGHDVHLIILEGQREILIDKEVDELFVTLRDMQVVLFHEAQHGTLGDLVDRALANESLLAVVDAKEEIEHHAYHRNEEDNQRPCHRLCGLLVVEHHMNDGNCYQYPQQRHTYYIE